MVRWDWDEEDRREFDDDGLSGWPRLPHSGVGVASFIIGIATALFIGAAIAALALLDADLNAAPHDLQREAALETIFGALICGGGLANITGVSLGIAGVFQPNRRKGFAIAGLVLNCLILIGIGMLMLVGLMMTEPLLWD